MLPPYRKEKNKDWSPKRTFSRAASWFTTLVLENKNKEKSCVFFKLYWLLSPHSAWSKSSKCRVLSPAAVTWLLFLPKLMKSSFYDSARLLLLMKKERRKVENVVFMRSPYEALRYITKFAKPIKGGYTHEFPLENHKKSLIPFSQVSLQKCPHKCSLFSFEFFLS